MPQRKVVFFYMLMLDLLYISDISGGVLTAFLILLV